MTKPFFQSPDEHTGARARLLLLSYHFPPAFTAGALRWQKLVEHAVARGWAVDVVTLHPDDAERAQLRLLDDLPGGVRVYVVPLRRLWLDRVEGVVWQQYRRLRPKAKHDSGPLSNGSAEANSSARRRDSLGRNELSLRSGADLRRAYLSWRSVSGEGAWAADAGRLAARILDSGVHRVVISCGPPHAVHVAASRLARDHQLPHVVDMRDPWSLVERLPENLASPIAIALARKHERRVVSKAALLVANTEPARDALRQTYPDAARRMIAVMNGYDDDPLPQVEPSSRFVIAYAGTVYLDRDPRPLFRAVARLKTELGLEHADLGIELMGNVKSFEGRSLQDLAENEGVAGLVQLHPLATRNVVQRFLAGAALLVSLPQDSEMAIPSKIFEYLQYPAWILALAEPASATALALRGTRADVVSPTDEDTLFQVLRRRFLQHREGVRAEPEPRNGPLSRAVQATCLFDAIEKEAGYRSEAINVGRSFSGTNHQSPVR